MQRLVRVHPVIMAVGGILLITGAIMAISGVTLFASDHETQNDSEVSAFKITNDPKPLAKVPADENTDNSSGPGGTSSNTQTRAGSANDTSGNTHAVSPIMITKNAPAPTGCTDDMSAAVDDYNHDIQKEKDALSSILSFKVSLNISSQYVTDYNSKVTSIYDSYLDKAKADHCSWPVKDIPVLDPNHPY